MWVRYRPELLRVSTGPGANYRSVATVFDDRYIDVYVNSTHPQRNRTSSLNYWANANGNRPGVDAPIRWDRRVMAYTRTSGDGGTATQPYLKTLRLGLQLPLEMVALRLE